MNSKTRHFFKSLGFTSDEIDHISKEAGNTADLLPRIFIRQLERNRYHKTPGGYSIRKMSPEDFTKIVKRFKEQVLKNPLKAIAKLAKGNVLKIG